MDFKAFGFLIAKLQAPSRREMQQESASPYSTRKWCHSVAKHKTSQLPRCIYLGRRGRYNQMGGENIALFQYSS
jgi:hypothetical protein